MKRKKQIGSLTKLLRTLAVAVLATTSLSVPAAQAGTNSSQFPLAATVYDLRSGAPVDLTGRVRLGTDVTGSAGRGWTVTLSANLDSVTGNNRQDASRYIATGAGSTTARFDSGPLPKTMSITPTFALRPPSPAKSQPFQLMLIASLSDRGAVIAVEVRSPAPPVAFAVDRTVQPDQQTVPAPDGSAPRPVVRLADSLGSAIDYVADELTLTTNNPTVLAGFVSRWKGQVLRTIEPPDRTAPSVHVVRVDASAADLSRLTSDVAALDPTAHGPHKASSGGALRLFAAAMREQAAGLHVGLNSLYTPQDYVNRSTTEAPDGDADPAGGTKYDRNSGEWSYFEGGGTSGFGVTEAWRILEVGGRLANRVRIGVIDVGCRRTNQDYPAGAMGGNDMPYLIKGDPWHCTNVANTAAGVPDNGFGTAGTGGPVADLRMYPTDMTDDNAAAQVYAASRDQAAMINMSFGANHPAIANLLDSNLEDAIDYVHGRGMLVFAAAGNAREGEASQDVDHMTCYFVCVEEAIIRPCEFDGVTCVGGLRSGTHDRDINSYYCLDRRPAICDVDVYAPFTVYKGGTAAGDNSANEARLTNGTSFSSPYVAGVAALMLAANPRLTNLQVEGILSNGLATTDPTVSAVIDAKGAMLRAFGNVPPMVRIAAPNDQSTVDYGGVNATRFIATTLDIEEGTNTLDVTWSSSVDGLLGSGRTLDYVFPTPGARRITATTTDRQGALGQTSIVVTATNRTPVVRIAQPYFSQVSLTVAATYIFRAEVQDQMNAPQPELCGDVIWTSSVHSGSSLPQTGCQISVTFTSTGFRDVYATYTDPEGAQGSARVRVEVTEQQVDSPPVVVIDSPAHGATFLEGATIPLRGSVYLEPGEDSPVDCAWYLGGVLIGESANIDFRPGDPGYVTGEQILTFGCRDDDGYAEDRIDIRIAARPK